MGAWEMLAEAGLDDDDDEVGSAKKPWQDNPLLRPSGGPAAGERPTSMSPSAAGIGSGAVAQKDKERSDLPASAVNRVPKSASTLAKMGISPKKYFSDDDPASATQRQLRAGGKKPEREPQVAQKPGYPGSVVGQTYTRAGQSKSKSVSWQDKASGERKYGRVQGKPERTDELVWDGEDWVTPAQYQAKMWSKRMGKKTESVWLALEKMTSVKPDPNASKKPPTYLPGVHRPDSPMRPGKKLKPRPADAPPAAQNVAGGDVDEAGLNFGKLNRQKNIQRYGTQDRRGDDAVAQSRLQKALAARKQARSGGAPAPEAPVPGSMPRAAVPPKPKTSFAGGSTEPDMSNPLMRPSPLDPDKKRELESILRLEAAELMECGCGGAWGAAMEAAEKDGGNDEPKEPKKPAKKDSKPKDDDGEENPKVAAGELPPDAVAAIRGAIESLESLVTDVDPEGDDLGMDAGMDDLDADSMELEAVGSGDDDDPYTQLPAVHGIHKYGKARERCGKQVNGKPCVLSKGHRPQCLTADNQRG